MSYRVKQRSLESEGQNRGHARPLHEPLLLFSREVLLPLTNHGTEAQAGRDQGSESILPIKGHSESGCSCRGQDVLKQRPISPFPVCQNTQPYRRYVLNGLTPWCILVGLHFSTGALLFMCKPPAASSPACPSGYVGRKLDEC